MVETKEPGGPPTLKALMDRFASVGTTEHWVASCYLKLEPRDRARGKYQIKLKNRIKQRMNALEDLGLSRTERDTIDRDLQRIREYLDDSTHLPMGRGIAIFACEPLGLFETVPLPHVFRSRLVVDRSPLVRELVALHDEFGLVHCAVCDRTSARFFRVTAFGVQELTGRTPGATTRANKFHGTRAGAGHGGSVAGAGEHNFNRRMQKEKDRHYADVAERLLDLSQGEGARGVVVGGNGTETNALIPHLHPYVRNDLLGTTKLNPKTATPSEIMEAVLTVRRESEREWEEQHITKLKGGLGTGWAVSGVEETLRALSIGQVRTLLVDPTAALGGFRCRDSGRLTIVEGTCSDEGGALGLPDIIDEAIEEALHQGCHVNVIENKEARSAFDCLAALLRFTGA
jgi:peptide subunit release factor 1 (eRF1)